MDFYTIYTKNNDQKKEPIAIKEGFSWYNLFFNLFWAVYKRIWVLALIYIILIAIFQGLRYLSVSPLSVQIINLASYVIIAFNANDFYRYSLKLKGYILQDIILAKSSNHAIYNFLKKNTKKA